MKAALLQLSTVHFDCMLNISKYISTDENKNALLQMWIRRIAKI
jgi:hypothetical protein